MTNKLNYLSLNTILNCHYSKNKYKYRNGTNNITLKLII